METKPRVSRIYMKQCCDKNRFGWYFQLDRDDKMSYKYILSVI